MAQTHDYYYPVVFSARRFFSGLSNDLTGGTYAQGCDYNRTYVQDVFLGSGETGAQSWWTGMSKIFGKRGFVTTGSSFKYENLLSAAKEFFDTVLEDEAKHAKEIDMAARTYIYRDATGLIKPYPARAIEINPLLGLTEAKPKKEAA